MSWAAACESCKWCAWTLSQPAQGSSLSEQSDNRTYTGKPHTLTNYMHRQAAIHTLPLHLASHSQVLDNVVQLYTGSGPQTRVSDSYARYSCVCSMKAIPCNVVSSNCQHALPTSWPHVHISVTQYMSGKPFTSPSCSRAAIAAWTCSLPAFKLSAQR